LEGDSEVTASPDFVVPEEEVCAGEVVADVVSSAFFSLLVFFGNFLENPAGTSRSINSKNPRLRIINRMMKLNLHECLVQNGTVKALNVGSSGMIPSPGACLRKNKSAYNSFQTQTGVIIYARYKSQYFISLLFL
jgi:hypothetical protein